MPGCRLFLAACLILLPSALAAREPARHPNIILILADDLGHGDLGCYGSKQVATEHIDALAQHGLRFTQFYVASPICSPSRVGFTTGMFPARWKINSYLQTRAGNRHCEQADWLEPRAPSLARTLKDAGYATGHFGKWHMGGGRDVQDAPLPSAYGFDEHHVNFEGMGPRFEHAGIREPVAVDGKEIPRHAITAYWVDRGIDFIRRHRDAPFYLNLWPQDTHDPFKPSDEQREKIPDDGVPPMQRDFRAVLKELDHQVGRLLAALHELGLDEETIVIFTADNGPQPSFDHVRTGGLRGQKWSLYEGGIRSPFIVRWKGVIPAGKVNDTTVLASVDLFPTLCRLADVKAPADAHFDGEDLSAAFRGETPERTRPLFWEYGRKPDGYLYPKPAGDKSPNVAVRAGRWKLLVNADGSGAELYDLEADVKESKNLADTHSDITRRLKEQALVWRKSLHEVDCHGRWQIYTEGHTDRTAFLISQENHTMTRLLASALFLFLLAGPVVAADADGFTPLFNGKDLTGWKVHPDGTGQWKVESGAIVGTGPASHLFTERGDYTDFHLRAEVSINEGGNSGMYFRTEFGPGFPKGYEAQINSTHRDPVKTGSIYRFPGITPQVLEKVSVKDMLVKPDEWFTYEVICKGNHITVKVNGKQTVDFTDAQKTYQKGHFAFQQHHVGNVVKIRKVEVKELGAGK